MKSSTVSDEKKVDQREASAAFNDWKYDAFISYRHRNPAKPIADRLQKLLETYVPPKELHLDLNRKLHLFRDEAELPTSNDLGSDIKTALEQSRFLIVICTPDYEESRWCMEEIAYFKSLHNGSNRQILTLSISDPNQPPVFPETLRFEPVTEVLPDGTIRTTQEEIEPLAANISAETMRQSMKKLKTEFLRIAAPILGCGFDDLYQREQRRRTQRKLTIAFSAAGIMAAAAALSAAALITINAQRAQIAADAQELRRSNVDLLLQESDLLKSGGDLYGALRSAVQASREEAQGDTPSDSAAERIASLTGAFEPDLFTATQKIEMPEKIKDLCLLDSGRRLAVVTENETELWNTENGQRMQCYDETRKNVAFYRNHVIDRATVTYYAKGSVQAVEKDGVFYYDLYRKDLREEKQSSEHALYVIREEDSSVQRISTGDGSVAWSTALRFPSFLSGGTGSAEGVIVYDSDALYVLDPTDGGVLARSDRSEIEAGIGHELHKVNDCSYAQDRLVLYSSAEGSRSITVFRREGESLVFLYQTELLPEQCLGESSLIIQNRFILFSAIFHDKLVSSTAYFAGLDLDSGEKLWEYSEEITTGAIPFTGYIPPDSGSENAFPVGFAVVGNRMFAVNAQTGDLILSERLPNDTIDLYYSENGFVFLINESGREYFIALRRLENTSEEFYLQLNREFNTQIGDAAYSNHTYAVSQKDGTSVFLYHPIINQAKTEVYRYDNEDHALAQALVSPDGTTAVVTMPNEKTFAVLDLSKNEVLYQLPLEGRSVSYLGSGFVAQISYDQITIHEISSGQCVQELSGQDYALSDAQIDPQHGTILVQNRERKALLMLRPDEKPETIVTLEQLDAGESDALVISSFSEYSLSPSGENVMFAVRQSQGSTSLRKLFLYHSGTGEITALDEQPADDYARSDACAWAEDDSAVYLLYGSTVCGYHCDTGERFCCSEIPGMKPVDLIVLGSDLCVLDVTGTLTKLSFEDGQLMSGERISTGLENVVSGNLTVERHGSELVFLRYHETAWRIDEGSFRVIYKIPRFSGCSDLTNQIYTRCYHLFYAYPLLSAEEVAERGEAFLRNEF